MNRLGIYDVPGDVLRLAAGMFRLNQGFPGSLAAVGSVRDAGDLFEGQMVRTARNTSSGFVTSSRFGVDGKEWRAGIGPLYGTGVSGRASLSFEQLEPWIEGRGFRSCSGLLGRHYNHRPVESGRVGR